VAHGTAGLESNNSRGDNCAEDLFEEEDFVELFCEDRGVIGMDEGRWLESLGSGGEIDGCAIMVSMIWIFCDQEAEWVGARAVP